MNALRAWLKQATPAQRAQLVKLAKTTPGALHQLAGAYRTKGVLRASPELARRIEIATKKIGVTIKRTDLAPVCKRCEFAKRCGQ